MRGIHTRNTNKQHINAVFVGKNQNMEVGMRRAIGVSDN